MRLRLPRWVRGQRPKAADLSNLSRWVEWSCNLDVDGATGLQLEETASGRKLSFVPTSQESRRAVVTQAITPPGSTASTHTAAAGWGFAQLQRWNNATSSYVNLGSSPVKVINPWPASTTTATVGKVVWVSFSDGVWQMVGENC